MTWLRRSKRFSTHTLQSTSVDCLLLHVSAMTVYRYSCAEHRLWPTLTLQDMLLTCQVFAGRHAKVCSQPQMVLLIWCVPNVYRLLQQNLLYPVLILHTPTAGAIIFFAYLYIRPLIRRRLGSASEYVHCLQLFYNCERPMLPHDKLWSGLIGTLMLQRLH